MRTSRHPSLRNPPTPVPTSFERQWRQRFERFGKGYESDHLVSGWSDHGLRCRLNLFAKLLKKYRLFPPLTALDLGCAAGTYVRFLAHEGFRVVGLDYSLPSLQRAIGADSARVGLYTGGEAYYLPFPDRCFDLVSSIGVFQALDDAPRALREMKRVLRPGGFLCLEFLNCFEAVSIIRNLPKRLRNEALQVRSYSLFEVTRWIQAEGLSLMGRAGVYLPPRNLAFLGRLTDSEQLVWFMEHLPGMSLIGAHAFFLVARK
ncbi:MAG: class I SAM-dependent methyltransferase [Acidobacteriota bacterium]